jgi:polar amino acid transport system substrate-binding protein
LTIYTEHFPPYNFIEDDVVTGINVEIVRRACELANVECQFNLYPWNRAMRRVGENTHSGIMSTARTPERENSFKWIGPLVSGNNCIYRLAERNDIIINSLFDAQAYTLGGARDDAYITTYQDLGFEVGQNLTLYLGKYGQMRPLELGRIDLIFGSSNTIDNLMSSIDLKLKDVVPVAMIPQTKHKGNYLALHSQAPADLATNLQNTINKLIENDEYANIQSEFLKAQSTKPPANIDLEIWHTCMPAG